MRLDILHDNSDINLLTEGFLGNLVSFIKKKFAKPDWDNEDIAAELAGMSTMDMAKLTDMFVSQAMDMLPPEKQQEVKKAMMNRKRDIVKALGQRGYRRK